MLSKKLQYFVCFIGITLSLLHGVKCRESRHIEPIPIQISCGEGITLDCSTEDGQEGVIMKENSYECIGKLVLHSVTTRDEGLYQCFLNSSILLKQYNVTILSDKKNRSCE